MVLKELFELKAFLHRTSVRVFVLLALVWPRVELNLDGFLWTWIRGAHKVDLSLAPGSDVCCGVWMLKFTVFLSQFLQLGFG